MYSPPVSIEKHPWKKRRSCGINGKRGLKYTKAYLAPEFQEHDVRFPLDSHFSPALVRLSASGVRAPGAGLGFCGRLPIILGHGSEGSGTICLTRGPTPALKGLGCFAWWLFWLDFGIMGEFGHREKAEEQLPDNGFQTFDFTNKPTFPIKLQRVVSQSYFLCRRGKPGSHPGYGGRKVYIIQKCPFHLKICSEELGMWEVIKSFFPIPINRNSVKNKIHKEYFISFLDKAHETSEKFYTLATLGYPWRYTLFPGVFSWENHRNALDIRLKSVNSR